MKHNGVLPITYFAYRKSLGTCDVLLCVSCTLQSVLESGQEAKIVQIVFRAAFDRVHHQGILYRLCSVGIGCFDLSILTQFLSDRSLHVMVMVVGVNWLTLFLECSRQVFWAFGAFYHSGN